MDAADSFNRSYGSATMNSSKTIPIKDAQEKWEAMQPRRSDHTTIEEQKRIIEKLRHQISSLEKAAAAVAKPLSGRENREFLKNDTNTVIGGQEYQAIDKGPNAGKLLTKKWKPIFDGGKHYKEWTIL
jgi:hypothetical protein